MAGSYGHVLDETNENYYGTSLLENGGDMKEAISMMAFMLLRLQHRPNGKKVMALLTQEYYACLRGEQPWPDWMIPGLNNDNML